MMPRASLGCLPPRSPGQRSFSPPIYRLREELEDALEGRAHDFVDLPNSLAGEEQLPRTARGTSLTDSVALDDHVHVVLVSRDTKRAGGSIDEHTLSILGTTADGLHLGAAFI
jgi:hypothetical protein